jgi:hypothetical protein
MVSFLALALVLPVMALRDRGLEFRHGWKMAAIWVALFALVAIVFGWAGL